MGARSRREGPMICGVSCPTRMHLECRQMLRLAQSQWAGLPSESGVVAKDGSWPQSRWQRSAAHKERADPCVVVPCEARHALRSRQGRRGAWTMRCSRRRWGLCCAVRRAQGLHRCVGKRQQQPGRVVPRLTMTAAQLVLMHVSALWAPTGALRRGSRARRRRSTYLPARHGSRPVQARAVNRALEREPIHRKTYSHGGR